MIHIDPNDLEIPDFLVRPLNDEVRRRIRRIVVRDQERRIKNPPRRASRKAKLLGFKAIGFKAPRGA